MSAVTVPKRNRRRKRKPKPSFTSDTSRSEPNHLPFNTEANFLRLLALFKIPQKAEQEERQCVVVGGDSKQVPASQFRSKTVFFPTLRKVPNEKPQAKIGSLNLKHLSKNKCEVSSSKSAGSEATFVEDDAIVRDIPTPTPLTQLLDVVDIVRQLRKMLQENGPSQEDDLLEALCASQAQIIISAYGTITAFLVRYPGFEVLYEELYTFVYYKCTDNEDDILDGAAAVSCIRHSNKSRIQYSLAGGDGFRRTSVIFSNSFSGGGDKQEKCRMKHGWSQVPWLPRCSSRALQAVRQTCEAEVQTEKCSSARLAEMNSMLQEREKRIAELKERLNTTRESQARQTQQLREKIELLKAAAPPPRRVKEVRNNEQPAGTNTAEGSSQLLRPRLPQRQTSPRRPKVEEKPRLLSSGQTARLDPPHRGGMQVPRHRAEKRRTSPARPTVRPLSPRRCRTPSPRRKTWVKPRELRFGQMAWLAPPMRGGTPPRPKAEEKSRALTNGLKAQTLSPLRRRTPSRRRKADKNSRVLVCGRAARLGLEMPPGTRSPRSWAEENQRVRPLGQKARLLSPPRRRIASHRRKAEGSRPVLPFGQAARLVPPMHRETPSSRPKIEKPRTRPLGAEARPVSPLRRTPSPRPKTEKSCSLPSGRTTQLLPPLLRKIPPQPNAIDMPRVRPLGPNARLPHRTSSPLRKAEGKPRAHPLGQTAHLVSPKCQETQSRRHETEKTPALPLKPTARRASPLRRISSPRPKAEGNPHRPPNGSTRRPIPPRLRKSDEQQSLPVCDELKPGRRNRVSTQRLDVESKPSSQVASRVKSKAEQQMAKLVQMVKRKKPEYTEQEIRVRLDDLRRSQGGFSSMTFRDIVALMLGLLEEKR